MSQEYQFSKISDVRFAQADTSLSGKNERNKTIFENSLGGQNGNFQRP
jgi:hypothetical protein